MYNEFDIASDETVTFVSLAISDSRISTNIQGIHRLGSPDDILYGECLARMTDCSGRVYTAGDFVPALELLGASPILDRYMLLATLDHLEKDENATLGCNVSADNFCAAEEYRSFFEILLQRPQLASRLFLEITETRPLGNLGFAQSSIESIRALGCKIAIDDFGSGFFSPITLTSLEVDIVKIDANFLWQARTNLRARNALTYLVDYARCFATIVVLEGVEIEADYLLAEKTRATHVQGHLLSRPILLRD